MSNTQQNPKDENLRFNTNHDPNATINNHSNNPEELENDILNQIVNETDNTVYTAVNTPLINETIQNNSQQEDETPFEPEKTVNLSTNEPIIENQEINQHQQTEDIKETTQTHSIDHSKEIEETEEEITELQNPIINTSLQQPLENTQEININQQIDKQDNLNSQSEQTPQTEIPQENSTQSFVDNIFSFFAKLGLPVLLILSFLLCGQQILFPRDFWFAEEVRFADIYMNMFSSNNFFMLMLNGQPYAETGPLFYYLVRFIDLIPAINMPQAFFIAMTLCMMLLTTSTWLLTRGIGYSNKVAFCAGLITLSCLSLASLSYYIRMDLLFISLLNFSYLCFYRAWKKESAPIWLIFAFLFLALACLSQQLLFFVLPFIASFFFLIWTSKLSRINSADGILGFLLSILLFFAWFGYIYMQGKADYISLILNQQIIQLFTVPTINSSLLSNYLLILPFAFLPFIFTFFFADWINWCKNIGVSIKNRKQDNASAWIVILILCHLLLLLFFNQSISSIIAILVLFSILSAKIIMNFSVLRNKIFFILTSFFTFLLGLTLILSEFQTYIFKFIPIAQSFVTKIPFVLFEANAHTSYGLATMGILLCVVSIILLITTKKCLAGGSLLLYSIGIIISMQPVTTLLTPQISSVLSPKPYAIEMANQNKTQNVTPVTLGIPANIFTYYYNMELDPENYQRKTISQLKNIEELTDFLLNNEAIILAIPEQEFKQITYKDEAIVLPYHQYIGTQKILLTIWQISSQSSRLNTKKEKNEQEIIPPIDNLLEPKEKDAIINVQPNSNQQINQDILKPEISQPTEQLPNSTLNNQDEISL